MILEEVQMSVNQNRQLIDYLKTMWQSFRNHKQGVTELLHKCRRQRQGVYEADILQAIRKFGGSEEFVKLTARKCQIAESWLVEAFINSVENSWTIKSSTGDDADNLAARKMTNYVSEQLHNGGYKVALSEFINDICTYPAAILKGPVITSKKQLKYIQNNRTQKWQVTEVNRPVETFKRVSPFDFYPAPNCKDISHSDVIEKIYLTAFELQQLADFDYYEREAISAVIKDYYENKLNNWTECQHEVAASKVLADVKETVNFGTEQNSLITALEFRCHVPADLLPEELLKAHNLEKNKVYDMWGILVGDHIIKLQFNPEVMNRRPYYVASFCENNDSIWGEGIPQKIAGPQRSINATKRALINNLAIASGPQVTVNLRALPPESKITKMHPWKIWQYKGDGVSSGSPFNFFQPQCNTELLLTAIEKFGKEADEDSGIPPYLAGEGNNNDNVMKTFGGLSMMVNISSKSIKRVISNIDQKVVIPLITALYNLNMLDEECSEDCKGDLTIEATGIYGALAHNRNSEEQMKQMTNLLENDDVKELLDDEGVFLIVKKICDLAGIPSNVLKAKKEDAKANAKPKSK